MTDRYWKLLADLPISIDRVTTSQHDLAGATSFVRRTTIVELHGSGHVGRGENISYSSDIQMLVPAHIQKLDLAGSWTLASFSAMLNTVDLVPAREAAMGDSDDYHRWAVESAALDLALRQAEVSFAQALSGARPHADRQPVTFCLSMGLGDSPSADRVLGWLKADPSLTFKIDANRNWDDVLCAQLAATGAVRVVDIKGQYTGDWIDNTPDPDLYERLARLLPDVVLEDPFLNPETIAALGPDGMARHAWDAPLHSLGDITTRVGEHRPAAINIKPSRFGTVRELLRSIAWCEDQGLPMYGGGQYELGHGRTQIQDIASVFYPDADNDVAPVAYHGAMPGDDVPRSPIEPPQSAGFGWTTS